MHLEPRETAAADSYPTFWNDDAPLPQPVHVPAEEAYAAFVNCSEDEFPEDAAHTDN